MPGVPGVAIDAVAERRAVRVQRLGVVEEDLARRLAVDGDAEQAALVRVLTTTLSAGVACSTPLSTRRTRPAFSITRKSPGPTNAISGRRRERSVQDRRERQRSDRERLRPRAGSRSSRPATKPHARAREQRQASTTSRSILPARVPGRYCRTRSYRSHAARCSSTGSPSAVDRIDPLDLGVPVADLEREPRRAERLALRAAAARRGTGGRLRIAGHRPQQIDAARLGVPAHGRGLGRLDVHRRFLVAHVVGPPHQVVDGDLVLPRQHLDADRELPGFVARLPPLRRARVADGRR